MFRDRRSAIGFASRIILMLDAILPLLACQHPPLLDAAAAPNLAATAQIELVIEVELPLDTGDATLIGLDDCQPDTCEKPDTIKPRAGGPVTTQGARVGIPSGGSGYGLGGDGNGYVPCQFAACTDFQELVEATNTLAASGSLFRRLATGVRYMWYDDVQQIDILTYVSAADIPGLKDHCGAKNTCTLRLKLWLCGASESDGTTCQAAHIPGDAAIIDRLAGLKQAEAAIALTTYLHVCPHRKITDPDDSAAPIANRDCQHYPM